MTGIWLSGQRHLSSICHATVSVKKRLEIGKDTSNNYIACNLPQSKLSCSAPGMPQLQDVNVVNLCMLQLMDALVMFRAQRGRRPDTK